MTDTMAPGFTRVEGSPRACLASWLASLQDGCTALLVVDFLFSPWWEDAPPVPLSAIYLHRDGRLRCAVSDRPLGPGAASPQDQYQRWVDELGLLDIEPGRPLPLCVTAIAKPWGRELWYTGVEARGVCRFGAAAANAPIPWVQAVLPDNAAGKAGEPLVLLKVLDPSPEAVTGDLYFELHEEKREVYVVTHVDRSAWPDGVGYIRYGFRPERVAEAGSEDTFRQLYRQAVADYEAVRREIDALADPAAAPEPLRRREQALRAAMEDFTWMRPLRVGDVVVVPLHMPHSLQHGVRTIEFQTPVYERKILSFAQRVLTQEHWDTEEAVQYMRLQPPPERPFEQLPAPEGVSCERIVDFDDFEVRRIRVAPGAQCQLLEADRYSLVMGVEGHFSVAGVELGPEQALLLPAGSAADIAVDGTGDALCFLQALPRG